MVYLKNIGTTERRLRVAAGIVAAIAGVAYFGFTPVGFGIAAAGIMGALTGAVGFCPACALVGRKLKGPQ